VINYMFSLPKLHVVDLTGSLSPFIPVFIGELHSLGHLLIPIVRESISD
jgi:hypothetical protein